MREMLLDAKKNHYAIPAFDISNYEMMKAVVREKIKTFGSANRI
jgi:fructose/tagatose bisphosphate aldolase